MLEILVIPLPAPHHKHIHQHSNLRPQHPTITKQIEEFAVALGPPAGDLVDKAALASLVATLSATNRYHATEARVVCMRLFPLYAFTHPSARSPLPSHMYTSPFLSNR